MIEHIWSVLCAHSIIDRETNNVSLIEVVEEVTVQAPIPPGPEGKPPLLTITPTIVTLWRREPEDQPTKGRGRMLILAPYQNKPKQISVYEIDLSEKLRLRLYGTLPGIPFRGPGTYRFVIQLQDEGEQEWKEVTSIPLRIVMRAAETPSLPPAQ
jgi:hypothetical protein